MDVVERGETLTVPFKVIREATLNTIIHRDWDAYNLTPSIAIFDDRVEFQNPGDFPLGSTYKDFIDNPHSSPVNPKIADVFFKSGLMEDGDEVLPTYMMSAKNTDYLLLNLKFGILLLTLHKIGGSFVEHST